MSGKCFGRGFGAGPDDSQKSIIATGMNIRVSGRILRSIGRLRAVRHEEQEGDETDIRVQMGDSKHNPYLGIYTIFGNVRIVRSRVGITAHP